MDPGILTQAGGTSQCDGESRSCILTGPAMAKQSSHASHKRNNTVSKNHIN